MSYAYIPRTSKCQAKLFFELTSRLLETFAVFNRLFRNIEIHNQGATKGREIKRSRPNKNRAVTRCSSEGDGIEKGINRSLRFWFGGRSDAISRRSATLAGAY